MSPYQLEFAIHYATRADDFLDHHPDSKVYRETVDQFIELGLIQLSPMKGVAWAGTDKLRSYVKRLGDVSIDEPQAMQMTPDQYADYIADASRYQRGQHRWQAVRDRAMKVIEEIMAEPKPDHVCHPDWQNTSICNDCGKPMKGAKP